MTTQTETNVATAASADVKVELTKLFQAADRAAGQGFVTCLQFIQSNNVDRAIVKDALIAKGLTKGSAAVECSHIFNILKEENKEVLEKLVQGNITIAQARVEARGRSNQKSVDNSGAKPEVITPEDKFLGAVAQVTMYHAAQGKDLQSLLQIVTDSFNKSVEQVAKNNALANTIAQKQSATAPAAKGSVEATNKPATPAKATKVA